MRASARWRSKACNAAHWIVLDYDDVVIHVFFEPTRDFYRLESNWSDTQEVPLPEPFLLPGARTALTRLRLSI